MLRVKAKQAAYWKAESLDIFDGARWRESPAGSHEATIFELPANRAAQRRWTQRIKVSIRNLRTRSFVTAGIAVDAPDLPNRAAIPSGPPGIWFASRTLRRGDTYTVPVYTPRPTERQLATAGTLYDRDFSPYLSMNVRDPTLKRVSNPSSSTSVPVQIRFADWNHAPGTMEALRLDRDSNQGGQYLDGLKTLDHSNFKRTWALAQRLKRGADNPLQYAKAVEAYLGRGFTYSESPPTSAGTLEGFLFTARSGYCQQYSGAMALLMRMAGIPTRVASGFTSGSFDRRSGEYVVRDLDAHSWVEAWFPDIGWVTFDPTPSTAPPRSQSNGERGGPVAGDAPDLGGTGRRLDPRRSVAAGDGTRWELVALGGALVIGLLVLAGLAIVQRRRAGAPLPELERALRRARRTPGPGATLQALEASFERSPAAAGYVRALREQRYGGRGGEPTRSQRRGLRTELGRGGGPIGRLRAWWALPPRPPLRWGRRRTLGGHG
jgi:transglutaminase-like putative cysteine protease